MTFLDSARTFSAAAAQKLLGGVLQQGPMPSHVAIIMDGNRRFARKNGYKTVVEGHRVGGKALHEMIPVFADIGVQELTVYAFSTENFNRSEQEVKGLVDVLTTKAQQWCNDLENLEKKGISVEVIGDYTKAPTSHLRHLLTKLMWSTKANKKFKLNIAFAYTAQEQVTKGLNTLMNGLANGLIDINDVDKNLLHKVFTVHSSNPVDLLIRTGGDERLSDFMMWQSGHAYMDFMKNVTWPEFNYWHLCKAMFRYQMQVIFNGLMPSAGNEEKDLKENSWDGPNRKELFLSKNADQQWVYIMTSAVNIA